MSILAIIEGLPDETLRQLNYIRKHYGMDTAIRYILISADPDLNRLRRGLPRQHRRRAKK